MGLVMPITPTIYLPFPRELYDDIVRFSDGRINPVDIAESEVRFFIAHSMEHEENLWGDRIEEVAEKYAPDVLARWREEDEAGSENRKADNKPLVWKEVSIPAGSEVRMAYGDTHHYATVKRGRIIDDGKKYSPSEWASKVAGGTARNAWRDLWFKRPAAPTWVPAQLLRDQARAPLHGTPE
jgi:hypothetical protein